MSRAPRATRSNAPIVSPSLRWLDCELTHANDGKDGNDYYMPMQSPSLLLCDEAPAPCAERPKAAPRVGVEALMERVAPAPTADETMKRAAFPRASRAARASEPTEQARREGQMIMRRALDALASAGYKRAPRDAQAFRSHRVGVGSGGKGPGIKTSAADQDKANHLAAIKAKDIDANNTEPAFLLGGYTAPMMWGALAESAFKANAVYSSQMGRKKTESATPQ